MRRSGSARSAASTNRISTAVPCCITGGRDAVVIASRDRAGKPLQTVISTDSGLVFTDPRPTPTEIRRFYANDYRQQYKKVHAPKPRHVLRAGRLAMRRLDAVAPYLADNAKLLDAGSGGGEFVYISRQRGYAVHGIEPNRGYAQHAIEQYGIDLFNGFYQDAQFAEGAFDCVTLFHVLEHLEEPAESLRVLSRYLKRGGHFVVEVPDVTSTATAPGQKWHLGHLYNFNGATLAAVGMKAGLTPLSVQRSRDGGVLFAIFCKTGDPPQHNIADVLAGNFESTYRVLSQHTAVSHYLRLSTPLSRLFSRGKRCISEHCVAKRYEAGTSKQILDDLISSAARPEPHNPWGALPRTPVVLSPIQF